MIDNDRDIREELDLIEELRTKASLREQLIKQKVAARYNTRVQNRDFSIGQLVLKRADVGGKNARQGKLTPNWEGPYRVINKTGKGAYELETMDGSTIPRTWNVDKLRKYYI